MPSTPPFKQGSFGGKNDKGEVLIVERDPKQGLKLFALNILHPEVRDYLTGIFHTIVRQWGFDMIKLSCLYFAAAKTPPDKTRGQMMFEAIQFVRNAVGLDTHLVVTEVPIASVFGIAETCQTTAKISPKWGLPWQKKRQLLTDYQLVTKVWLFRIALPKRVFLSDTQTAFFDRQYLKLNKQQQRTLLFVNALCNNSLTLSDSLVALTEAQVEDTRQAIFLINAQIIGLSEILTNVYEIIVRQHEKNYYFFMNLTGYELAIRGPKPCSLAPFETKIVPV